MAFDNTNKGALFTQKDRESEKHPHMTGKINIDGTDYRLAAWSNVSKKGDKYLSLKVSEIDSEKKEEDDGLPF